MSGGPQNGAWRKASGQERLEFAFLWVIVKGLGLLPRPIARQMGVWIGRLAFRLVQKLRKVGLRNLELAYPERDSEWRSGTLVGLYRSLGLLMAEFCLMSGYTREQASEFIEYDGLEHFLAARDRGKGVLVLTGHLGAWELSSFYHSLMGYPMGLVIRRLDNPLVDAFVNRIRCLHGNRVIHKDDFARGLIAAMRNGETMGILMDTNMTPPQGVFVPFFGREACTASGLAKVAMKTDAAVLPGFLLWDEARRKYRLCFGEPMTLIRTENADADVLANTAAFTATIERYVRQHPEQWLWLHRRWKTRPAGEAGVY
ncbi:lysophospholipid acyltransferase family protein [Granulicella tundricola]|uniref:Lipid A biosynthesis acyltransferase n=1 Tax=Granulicella tundricola (strain ATCC BAA-1859 / DSM 23138 / MP5ACTX9) TaxID=1198114 RepID=E8WWG1_GRATM|nr:lysophospholipid acyltransferase family protein [Granulicella tundricola]ADW69625.1 lipid A biosynthesis acyltransferase [Granulicella tundricola MP5ACTX9]